MKKNNIVYTNEVNCNLMYKAINDDFDIFSVSLIVDESLSDNEKKQFIGAHILDLVDMKYNAISVLYRYGNKLYCLYNKGVITSEQLAIYIKENLNINVAVDRIESTNDSRDGIYEADLIQLLCNSLTNEIDNPYRNLSGKLYFMKSNSIERDANTNEVKKIKSFHLEFMKSKKMSSTMTIQVKTVTFNPLDKLLQYYKKEEKLKKIHKAPKYILDSDGNFRRILKEDDFNKNQLFVAMKLGKKTTESFLNFESITGFMDSKMGILYQFLQEINYYLYPYLNISLCPIETNEIINKLSENLIYKNEKTYFKRINDKGINVYFKVNEDNRISEFKDVLLQRLKDCGITNVSCFDELNESKYNIIVIHDEDYYKDRNLKDPHVVVLNGQHMIFEKYIKKNSSDLEIQSVTVRKILYELLIKEDIRNSHISLYNFKNCDGSLFYAKPDSYTENGEKKRCYHVLKVCADSSLQYLYLDEKSDNPIYNRLNKYTSDFCYKYIRISDLEYIIFDEGEAVGIINNDVYTIPNLTEIYKILNNYSKERQIMTLDLMDYMDEFIHFYPEHTEKISEIKRTIEKSGKKAYSYEDIANAQQKKNAKPSLISIKSKLGKDFIGFTRSKYGIVINPMLKSVEYEDVIRTGTTNINIFRNKNDILDRRVFYFVGFRGTINKYKVEKAVHIRALEPFTKSSHIINILLDQLNVDFVRLGEYTVYPFPIKYLNELVQYYKEKSAI